ncbi:hypothetical protein [Campylobacter sp. RM12637]|uniref:hypothetical protein n=1 Tax=Campylobacter sp. RM12637 TaxID=2735734 RepID=UPI003014F378|nr:hypothetical protein [Campylobacter sp. RM12637]
MKEIKEILLNIFLLNFHIDLSKKLYFKFLALLGIFFVFLYILFEYIFQISNISFVFIFLYILGISLVYRVKKVYKNILLILILSYPFINYYLLKSEALFLGFNFVFLLLFLFIMIFANLNTNIKTNTSQKSLLIKLFILAILILNMLIYQSFLKSYNILILDFLSVFAYYNFYFLLSSFMIITYIFIKNLLKTI